MSALVVHSGGMDSTVALYLTLGLHEKVEAVTVDYGQRHRTEIDHAAEHCAHLGVPHSVIDLSALGSMITGSALTDASTEVPHGHYAEPTMRSTVVPNRNAIMINAVAAVAASRGHDTLAVGVHAGDHAVYPDCRPEFISAVQASLDAALYPDERLTVFAPFVHRSKADIARLGDVLGVDWSRTWSCYEGGDVHCGRCGTCVERAEAFRLAGVEDSTTYLDLDTYAAASGVSGRTA